MLSWCRDVDLAAEQVLCQKLLAMKRILTAAQRTGRGHEIVACTWEVQSCRSPIIRINHGRDQAKRRRACPEARRALRRGPAPRGGAQADGRRGENGVRAQ